MTNSKIRAKSTLYVLLILMYNTLLIYILPQKHYTCFGWCISHDVNRIYSSPMRSRFVTKYKHRTRVHGNINKNKIMLFRESSQHNCHQTISSSTFCTAISGFTTFNIVNSRKALETKPVIVNTVRQTTQLNAQKTTAVSRISTDSKKNFLLKEIQVNLSTGVSMQVLLCLPTITTTRQIIATSIDPNKVLLFLHGSFHGAWCWMEQYGPYFASGGDIGGGGDNNNRNNGSDDVRSPYTVIAPSWRGTGGTFAGENVKKVTIMEHVQDLQSLLIQLPVILMQQQQEQQQLQISNEQIIRPIVVAHSFGGLAVMKLLEEHYKQQQQQQQKYPHPIEHPFSGIVLMCSVPPSGNGKMTLRFLRQRPWIDSYKITIGFAMKRCLTDISLCRQLFFDSSVDDNMIEQYQQYFTRDSYATIDLLDLSKRLPSSFTTSLSSNNGNIALFVAANQTTTFPPVAVMGAQHDYIVDHTALQETAQYFGLYKDNTNNQQGLSPSSKLLNNSSSPIILIESPHDVMLGSKWKNGANALYQWIQQQML